MNFSRSAAELFVPDGMEEGLALARITHLGIGAHQDDLEFMAFHGIVECFGKSDRWFGCVTCSDGAGSARCGDYANLSDAEVVALRREEQKEAARIGQYGAMAQLGYASAEIKGGADVELREDLCAIFSATTPEIVYTHNLADKHPTHVAVVLAVISALRSMPKNMRPRQIIGCEVWRDLDWLPDTEKVVMDVTGREKLADELAACFRSQIAGGKRYDVAVAGRRAANATFSDPRSTDRARQVIFGMDLTPMIENDALDPADYVDAMIERFRGEVHAAVKR